MSPLRGGPVNWFYERGCQETFLSFDRRRRGSRGIPFHRTSNPLVDAFPHVRRLRTIAEHSSGPQFNALPAQPSDRPLRAYEVTAASGHAPAVASDHEPTVTPASVLISEQNSSFPHPSAPLYYCRSGTPICTEAHYAIDSTRQHTT